MPPFIFLSYETIALIPSTTSTRPFDTKEEDDGIVAVIVVVVVGCALS
jgi:hypothetical protein